MAQYTNLFHHHHHRHWAAVVSHGWAKASACRLSGLHVSLYCAVLCQIVVFQYLSRSSLHRLAGLPCRHLLAILSPSGDKRGPSVVFEAVDMPWPGPFHFSHIADYILSITFVFSRTLMLVFLSLHVMLSILLSILVDATTGLSCACLVSVHISAPYVVAGSTHELCTCLFREMAMLLLKISRCLTYATQPAKILRCISLSWYFFP